MKTKKIVSLFMVVLLALTLALHVSAATFTLSTYDISASRSGGSYTVTANPASLSYGFEVTGTSWISVGQPRSGYFTINVSAGMGRTGRVRIKNGSNYRDVQIVQ